MSHYDTTQTQPKFVTTGNDAITLLDTVWDDLRVPAQATRINPAVTKPDFGTFKDGTLTFLFDSASVETVHFNVQIPHQYKLGTNLKPHVHWSPTTTNVGTVIWNLEYTIAEKDGVFGTTAQIAVTDTSSGTAFEHRLAGFPDISGTNIDSVSAMLVCALSRTATSDTYTADAALIEFDIHYEIDSIGSRDEYTK